MIFPYGCIDVVIKRSSLENIKEGLSTELIKEYNVGKGHYDKNLIIIVGGMSPYDVEDMVEELIEKYKLVHIKNNIAQDFVCVEPCGICSKCFWLKAEFLSKEVTVGNTTYPKHYIYYEYVNESK